jgi:hypothetical protein
VLLAERDAYDVLLEVPGTSGARISVAAPELSAVEDALGAVLPMTPVRRSSGLMAIR